MIDQDPDETLAIKVPSFHRSASTFPLKATV